MTNKEIKLELAKTAITCGTNIETIKCFYEWIIDGEEKDDEVEVPVTDFSNVGLDNLIDMIEHLSRKVNNHSRGYGKRVRHLCDYNEIHTISDLISTNRDTFRRFLNSGDNTTEFVSRALKELYNIAW